MTQWKIVRFGDVVRQVKDKVDPQTSGLERYVAGEHMDTDNLHIRRWGEIGDGYLGPAFHMRFKPGQVLYGSRRTYLRKVAVAEFEGICANTTYVIEPKDPDVLLPEFLPFVMSTETFHEHSIKQSKGSVNPYINFSDIEWYEFPLPPVDEQRHIADLLWAADDMIVRDEGLLASLKTYKKVLFESVIEKELANGIKLVKFGELMLRSPDSGHSPISVDRETGHYVLILSSLSPTGYRRGYLKPVELTPEVNATRLKKGDFLISRSNTVELVGLVGIYDEDRSDISFPDTMMRLILDETRIDRYFLEQFLLSRKARRKVQSFAAGTSGSMKKINRSHIASLDVPSIALEKQHSIMKKIQECTDGISAAEDRCTKSQELKKALLNRLLSA